MSARDLRVHKRTVDSLILESFIVVSLLTWMLVTELTSSEYALFTGKPPQ